jgi:hypothetical protein
MNNEILHEIAQQLGTAVEYIWPLLVRAQIIEGVLYLAVTTFLGFLALFFGRWLQEKSHEVCDFDGEALYVGGTLLIACTVLLGTMAAAENAMKLLAPEKSAIHEILKEVGE